MRASPEDCWNQLKPYIEELGVTHFVFRTQFLGMPLSIALAGMRLMSEELLPALRQGSVACSAATARLLVGPPPPHPAVRRAARLLDALVGGAWSGAAGVVDAVLDPIVFGVVGRRPPCPGDLTLWVPLVAWRW